MTLLPFFHLTVNLFNHIEYLVKVRVQKNQNIHPLYSY